MKTLKSAPLSFKNYPPVIKEPFYDAMLCKFIDQHLDDERDTLAELIVQNGKLWYSLSISNQTHKFMTIKVPL